MICWRPLCDHLATPLATTFAPFAQLLCHFAPGWHPIWATFAPFASLSVPLCPSLAPQLGQLLLHLHTFGATLPQAGTPAGPLLLPFAPLSGNRRVAGVQGACAKRDDWRVAGVQGAGAAIQQVRCLATPVSAEKTSESSETLAPASLQMPGELLGSLGQAFASIAHNCAKLQGNESRCMIRISLVLAKADYHKREQRCVICFARAAREFQGCTSTLPTFLSFLKT